jgi:CRISPR-associated protein Cas2
MLVIAVENAPPRPRDWLAVWQLGIHAGGYMGVHLRKVREIIWEQVVDSIENDNAVIAWLEPNDAGFECDICGVNRRVPVDLDGFQLMAFRPAKAARLLPTRADQNRWAQPRMPMDMMRQGCSTSLFHASQQWSTMSS